MKIRFWGVRGSYPVPGKDTVRYGGNTSCIEVRLDDGTWIILDAGTGLRQLGYHMMRNGFGDGGGEATFLLTHTHWDHIMGMPHFEPAKVAGNTFHVYGLKRDGLTLQQVFEGQQTPEYHDQSFSEFPAEFVFHEITEGDLLGVGSATVSTARLNHPNYALGYRIVADGGSVVYITDTSPYDTVLIEDTFIKDPADVSPAEGTPRKQEMARFHAQILRLMRRADLVIFDTFFEQAGYDSRPHWGHSMPVHAIENCKTVGVKRLALFHHAPENTDDDMDDLKQKYCDGTETDELRVIMSHEGLELSIP